MYAKSTLLNISVKAATSFVGRHLFSQFRNQFVPIFMLHRMEDRALGVKGHDPKVLGEALAFVRSQDYTVISLELLVQSLQTQKSLPHKSLVFTMDDGFYDQVRVAVPIFKQYDCPVSIFLLSNFSAGVSWPWDYKIEYILETTEASEFGCELDGVVYQEDLANFDQRRLLKRRLREHLKRKSTNEATALVEQVGDLLEVQVSSTPPESYRPITWAEARAEEDELVQFGPHSVNHAILANQSDTGAKQEIQNSWQTLKQELSNPLDVFCYPTGRKNVDFGDREMKIVKELGMRAALAVTPGYVNLREHVQEQYCLPRFGFPNNMEDFIQVCSWIELVKEKLRGNL